MSSLSKSNINTIHGTLRRQPTGNLNAGLYTTFTTEADSVVASKIQNAGSVTHANLRGTIDRMLFNMIH